MVRLSINGRNITVDQGTTILDAAKTAGVNIPTLCYLKHVNEIGACRVCVVEIEGAPRLAAACNTLCTDGMVVITNSHRVRQARRTNVELILSQHDCRCAACVRSGNCTLQSIANDLGILEQPYEQRFAHVEWPESFPLIRDSEKCIKCMRCVQLCEKIQGLGVWDVSGSGSRLGVDVAGRRSIDTTDCALCGQCITHCPVGALRERNDICDVLDALADPEKITVVQIAPAVRAAWGEALGLPRESATAGRLVAALKEVGFDYIFDTNFAADLTIMEEGSEFIQKFTEGGRLPLFTSCCPGWVRFLKAQYPELVPHLSTAKSPQQMFGAVAKSYYAQLLNVSPDRIFCLSVMPCVAKKHECAIPVMNSAGAGQDVDAVLTTREIVRLIKSEFINTPALDEAPFDSPLGISTGAAVIFGATGGVMEAALRTAYKVITGENPPADAFKNVRGMDGWREAEYDITGNTVKVAVANGLANARKLLEALSRGEVSYDFIEVMACPGGCVGGGGQPITDGVEVAETRSAVLYSLDSAAQIRFSHENPAIIKCYEDFFGTPLSHKSHELLHTDHEAWQMPPL